MEPLYLIALCIPGAGNSMEVSAISPSIFSSLSLYHPQGTVDISHDQCACSSFPGWLRFISSPLRLWARVPSLSVDCSSLQVLACLNLCLWWASAEKVSLRIFPLQLWVNHSYTSVWNGVWGDWDADLSCISHFHYVCAPPNKDITWHGNVWFWTQWPTAYKGTWY